jgi:hypothetical protein
MPSRAVPLLLMICATGDMHVQTALRPCGRHRGTVECPGGANCYKQVETKVDANWPKSR